MKRTIPNDIIPTDPLRDKATPMTSFQTKREALYFVFNRRVVSDQKLYITASTYAEALALARDGDCDETGDEAHVSVTIRPVKDTQ